MSPRTICILLFIFFSQDEIYGQHQFQRKYGNSHFVFNVRQIRHPLKETTLLFNLRDSLDSNGDWRKISSGFIKLDSLDQPKSCYNLRGLNADTGITVQDFMHLSNENIICAGVIITPVRQHKSCVFLLDKNYNFIRGTAFPYAGNNAVDLIKPDGHGNYFASMSIDSLFSTDTTDTSILCKLDSNLHPIWSKIYSSRWHPEIKDFQILSDGNILTCGYVMDSSIGPARMIVTKLDSTGNVIWAKKYNPSSNPQAHVMSSSLASHLHALSDGMMVYGYAWDSVYSITKHLMMKLDTAGNIIWCKKYMADFFGDYGMIPTYDGGYLLSGRFYTSFTFAALIKTDSLGNVEWNHYYQWGENNRYNCENEKGEFYSLGYTPTSPGMFDVYLIKTDTLGSTGCSENTFPITISDHNNFTVVNKNITALDYFGPNYSFNMVRDSLSLNEIIICDGLTSTNVEETYEINIFPNPVCSHLTIEGFDLDQECRIKIIDIYGRRILDESKILPADVSFESFSDGVYFVEISVGNKQLIKKIIKTNH